MHAHTEAKSTCYHVRGTCHIHRSKTQSVPFSNKNKYVTAISKSFPINILKVFLTENMYYLTSHSLIHTYGNSLIRLRKIPLHIRGRVKYEIKNKPHEKKS